MIAMIPADELVLARMPGLLEVLPDELHGRFDVQRRRERHRVDLPPHRLHHARMPMPERRDKDTANRIEVALPINVPEVESFGPAEDDRPFEKLGGGLKIDEGTFEQCFLAW